jgi:hypothetical protein
MKKLKSISGIRLIQALKRLDFEVVRTRAAIIFFDILMGGVPLSPCIVVRH